MLSHQLTTANHQLLDQGYCVVPADKRFLLLFTFLKKNMNKKVWACLGGGTVQAFSLRLR